MTSRPTRETIGAMRKLLALATSVSLSACSMAIHAPPDEWDGTTKPECTDDNSLAIGDGILGGLLIGVGAVGARVSVDQNDMGTPSTAADVVAIAGLLGGLVFVISSFAGEAKYKRCHDAMAEWHVGGRIGAASEAQAAKRKATVGEAKAPAAANPVVTPRGFYCSISPTVDAAGFCVRDKAECQRTRDAAIAGVADLSDCTLTERAFCFGDHCAPGIEACQALRGRVIGPDGTGPECADSE